MQSLDERMRASLADSLAHLHDVAASSTDVAASDLAPTLSARLTIGDKVQMLHENESIYVPVGVRDRLENPRKIDLELIERADRKLSRRGRHRADRGRLQPFVEE